MSIAGEVRVRVPASSANLGPGFDVLGLALGVYLRCTLRPSAGGLMIVASGSEANGIPQDAGNLIWKMFTVAAGPSAGNNFELSIENDIPLGRGMGSSAAAVVAGLALAGAYRGKEVATPAGRQELIEQATKFEGHPDNAAAAVLGGFVVSGQTDDGKVISLPCAAPDNIETLLVIPDFQLSTQAARAALPNQYSRKDAVFNLQRVGLLLAALQNGRNDLLGEAMRDRIHQPYRAPLVPGFAEILSLKNVTGLLATALSGAGPSVLALCEPIKKNEPDSPAAAIQACFTRNGVNSTAKRVPVDHGGVLIERAS
jgi:homoserine kinase